MGKDRKHQWNKCESSLNSGKKKLLNLKECTEDLKLVCKRDHGSACYMSTYLKVFMFAFLFLIIILQIAFIVLSFHIWHIYHIINLYVYICYTYTCDLYMHIATYMYVYTYVHIYNFFYLTHSSLCLLIPVFPLWLCWIFFHAYF